MSRKGILGSDMRFFGSRNYIVSEEQLLNREKEENRITYFGRLIIILNLINVYILLMIDRRNL